MEKGRFIINIFFLSILTIMLSSMIENKKDYSSNRKSVKNNHQKLFTDSEHVYHLNDKPNTDNTLKWLSIVSWGYPIAAILLLIGSVKLGVIAGCLLLIVSLISIGLAIKGFKELSAIDDKSVRKIKRLKLLLSLLLGIIGIIASIGIFFL